MAVKLNKNDCGAAITISDDGLTASFPNGISQFSGFVRANTCIASGKYYYEVNIVNGSTVPDDSRLTVGILSEDATDKDTTGYMYNMNNNPPFSHQMLLKSGEGFGYGSWGAYFDTDNWSIVYGNSFVVGDNVGIAFDIDNKNIELYKNGVLIEKRNITLTEGMKYYPALSFDSYRTALTVRMIFAAKDIKYLPNGYLPYEIKKIYINKNNELWGLRNNEL